MPSYLERMRQAEHDRNIHLRSLQQSHSCDQMIGQCVIGKTMHESEANGSPASQCLSCKKAAMTCGHAARSYRDSKTNAALHRLEPADPVANVSMRCL
jgi:hypothetical protein